MAEQSVALELPDGVRLKIYWPFLDDGSEDDHIVFEYAGTIDSLSRLFPTADLSPSFSNRGRLGRPKGVKLKPRVDEDGDRIRVTYRCGDRLRLHTYKPLENALKCPEFSVTSLLDRFRRRPPEHTR